MQIACVREAEDHLRKLGLKFYQKKKKRLILKTTW